MNCYLRKSLICEKIMILQTLCCFTLNTHILKRTVEAQVSQQPCLQKEKKLERNKKKKRKNKYERIRKKKTRNFVMRKSLAESEELSRIIKGRTCT